MRLRWLWITDEKFVATVDLNENDTVIETPPQLSQFKNKHRSILEFYLKGEFPNIVIQEKEFKL